MIKRIFLFVLVVVFAASCQNESTQESKKAKNTEVTVHELYEHRLSLPASYVNINAVQDLRHFFDEHGGKIAQTDPELFNLMVRNIYLSKRYYLDSEGGENFNFVYVDLVGPRFPLKEDIINNYVKMFEKEFTSRYASRNYRIEKLDLQRMTVYQNEIVNFKHKHTLDDLVWYTDYYYIQLFDTKKSVVLVSYDYNGGKLDLRNNLATFY